MTDPTVRRSPPSAVPDQSALPYALASEEDRCALRHPVSIRAKMRFCCSNSFPVEVTDLSISGFACDALPTAHPGSLCWLTLPGLGALEAEVVHQSNQGIGCSFERLLNPAVLDHFVAKYPVP